MVQKGYTKDLLSLTIATGYLKQMLENARIERHLLKHHPGVLHAIREILGVVSKEKERISPEEPRLLGVGESQPSTGTVNKDSSGDAPPVLWHSPSYGPEK
jgi:hypothetical protein